MDFLEKMRTFMRIVETGQLRAAAKSRGLSVAAVSRQLSALEVELGTTLVLRSSRKLAVTETGRRWYASCQRLLDEIEAARGDIADTSEPRGSVVVSAPISYGLGFLLTRFERLTREHPHLSLELRLEDQAVDLLGTGVDIAVRIGMTLPDSNAIIAHRLVTFRRALAASATYLRKRGTPKHPRELLDHDVLLHLRASPAFTRWHFTNESTGEQVEISPRAKLSSTSPVALRAWAESGVGITLIPSWLTTELKPVLKEWQTSPITAYALHRAETRNAARIRVVLEALANGMVDQD